MSDRMRLAWSVIDDDALYQVAGKGRGDLDGGISADNALRRLTLRVERQSFRRLSESRAIAFGIRLHQTRLDRVAETPGEAARLSAALRALPVDLARYKSILRFSDAVQGRCLPCDPSGIVMLLSEMCWWCDPAHTGISWKPPSYVQ